MALSDLLRNCDSQLRLLQERGLYRRSRSLDRVAGAQLTIDGRRVVGCSSNDYLGLSLDPRVIQAAAAAARRWGAGARASRLLAGTTALHAQLEAGLAAFFRTEDAIVYSSGYLANLGTLQTLLGRGDLAVVDRLAHASLIDACRASGARLLIFHHNDPGHLAALLRRYRSAGRRLVVTEGVFSMDGDAAPLAALLDVAERVDAVLYVDDAHGAFVRGATGRGSPEAADLDHARLIYMGTLGKALGSQGGFVVGPAALIDWLRNRARTYIYTTAPPASAMAAALEALRIVARSAAPRRALERNVRRFAGRLARQGIAPRPPAGHIVPILAGPTSVATAWAEQLWDRGFFAPAIRPPTVPEGTARLRISLSAAHTAAQLDRLARAIAQLSPKPKPAPRPRRTDRPRAADRRADRPSAADRS